MAHVHDLEWEARGRRIICMFDDCSFAMDADEIMALVSKHAAQQSVHPTVLNAREIETVCPNCNLVFDVKLPESHSG